MSNLGQIEKTDRPPKECVAEVDHRPPEGGAVMLTSQHEQSVKQVAAYEIMWTSINYIVNNKSEITNLTDALNPMIPAAIIIGIIGMNPCTDLLRNQRKIKQLLKHTNTT